MTIDSLWRVSTKCQTLFWQFEFVIYYAHVAWHWWNGSDISHCYIKKYNSRPFDSNKSTEHLNPSPLQRFWQPSNDPWTVKTLAMFPPPLLLPSMQGCGTWTDPPLIVLIVPNHASGNPFSSMLKPTLAVLHCSIVGPFWTRCQRVSGLDAALAASVQGAVQCSVWRRRLERGIPFYLTLSARKRSLEICSRDSSGITSTLI